MIERRIIFTALIAVAALAGCAESRTSAPGGLASSAQLQQDVAQRDKWTYRAPKADLTKYRRFQFEPTVVYQGADADFGSMPADERARMATIVGTEFQKVIAEKVPVVAAAGPDVARVKLTLLGVDQTIGGLATMTRLAPAGIAMNAARGAAGESGSFTGSIEVAVEAFDSQSNELVFAGIRRATPAVYDLEATLSTSETVRSSAMSLARTMRDGLEALKK